MAGMTYGIVAGYDGSPGRPRRCAGPPGKPRRAGLPGRRSQGGSCGPLAGLLRDLGPYATASSNCELVS